MIRNLKTSNFLLQVMLSGTILFVVSCSQYEFNNPHEYKEIPPPVVMLYSPLNNRVYGGSIVFVSGRIEDQNDPDIATAIIKVNETDYTTNVTEDGNFNQAVTLSLGTNTISVSATNKYNVIGSESVKVIYDPSAPAVTIEYPEMNAYLGTTAVLIRGSISDPSITEARVISNGTEIMPIFVNEGEYSAMKEFKDGGWNTVEVRATNASGNTGSSGEIPFYLYLNVMYTLDDSSGYFTTIAVGSMGQPHICYESENNELKYATWINGNWSLEIIDSVGEYPSIALGENGYPHISYYDNNNNLLKYAKKTSSGWSIEVVDQNGGKYTSIVFDSNEYAHISYIGAEGLCYEKWTGSKWQKEVVDSTGGANSIALDSNGYPHISYYDNDNKILKYAQWDGSSWVIETVDGSNLVGVYNSLAIDRGGVSHISYYDNTNHTVKYAIKTIESGWSVEVVDGNNNWVGEYCSMDIDEKGYPHISYYDNPNADLKYAYKDEQGWNIQTLDSSEYVGLHTSIAIDSNDCTHISYLYFSDPGIIKVKYITFKE